jgi:uncharacterized membrane protein YeaQ/YmgE (transglycosylase-associated protein family)
MRLHAIVRSCRTGVIGAFIGGWLLGELGIFVGAGIIGAIISALMGAIVLLVIAKLIRGGGHWSM